MNFETIFLVDDAEAETVDDRGCDYIPKRTSGAQRLSGVVREFMNRTRTRCSDVPEVVVSSRAAFADEVTGLTVLIHESGASIIADERGSKP